MRSVDMMQMICDDLKCRVHLTCSDDSAPCVPSGGVEGRGEAPL